MEDTARKRTTTHMENSGDCDNTITWESYGISVAMVMGIGHSRKRRAGKWGNEGSADRGVEDTG